MWLAYSRAARQNSLDPITVTGAAVTELRTTSTSEGLKRDIRRWDLVALFVNVTIGAGIFRLPSEIHAAAGAYSLVAFVLCAVVIGIIVLCFAEVSSRFTGTGGPYLYARTAFGPAAGFMVGWLMWLTRVTGFASLCAVFVDSLGYFWSGASSGPGRAAVIVAIVASLTAVNILGVRQSATLGNVLTVSKLVPLLLFVAAGLFFMDPHRFSFASPPGYRSFSSAIFVLIYAFSGFEAVLINSGEIRQPQRTIPFALLTSVVSVTILFVLIQVVCVGTLPDLATSHRPLADAAAGFAGPWAALVISAAALVSVAGTMNVVLLGSSRLPFAMAEQGQLPNFLAATHRRFHTPYISIFVSSIVVLALALSGTFIYLVSLSVITRVLVYASACGALLVLRRREAVDYSNVVYEREAKETESDVQSPFFYSRAQFRAPYGGILAVAALVACLWLITAAGWHEVRDVAIGSAIGLLIYAFGVRPGLRSEQSN